MNSHWTKEGHGTLLVMLHGFMGDSRTYTDAVRRLRTETDILRVDLPGHGADRSDLSETWSFDWIAEKLHEVISRESYQQVILYGYSMGGRIALYYALKYPVHALILESTSPGLERAEEREERQRIDQARGDRLMLDYEQFVQHWENLPLFKPAVPLNQAQQQKLSTIRRSQEPAGLKKALMDYGTGSQPNLWPELAELNCPVLLLTGTLDQKFKTINIDMAQRIKDSRHIEVSAGHSIHVEHPEIFDTIVLEFIKEA
ncbi:2-succinyl-6-hydroxy-2,4-cyclohexadiene-1-carboxylate synthase [Macrococcus brunensis]|uniref:Putative 2-succinyl-6-hydroxy-2,4-cyclohexadiene-1-carboxylate synthase n=1 Tax=Macrococcus brunensis TaxID=198483 RepID=A0A4R6BG06_9STAP|nr:2-succinyl-6-hydroxy-2,4-cyclohexadiene-1-carboxylate synthase [Macrococcus brunensis]TDL98693.1 2-succinyl-6-hydroxy-2,4-cyclohexadiene-1-carboxylate synthase [Macrococcus brunensis]